MSRMFEMDVYLKAPPERVWRALTTPEEMARWLGHGVHALELKPGGTFHMEGLHPGVVQEVDPPRRLAWAWDPENGTEPLQESVTLEPEGDGTRLRVKVVATGRWADDPMYAGGSQAGWSNWLEDLANWVERGVAAPVGVQGVLGASLGAEVQEDGERLFVRRVTEGGAAEAAGMQVGDVLLAWNGETLGGVSGFYRRYWRTEPGQRIRLALERDGRVLETEVTLGAPRSSA